MELTARRGDDQVAVLVDDQDGNLISGKLSIGSHGYAQGWFDKRVELLHRWLLGLVPGDGKIGDHINGNRLDCRRANLRVVTPAMSSANVKRGQVSGHRGVYPNKRRWAAAAKQHGRKIHLGTYDTPERAAEVAQAWRVANLPGYVVR